MAVMYVLIGGVHSNMLRTQPGLMGFLDSSAPLLTASYTDSCSTKNLNLKSKARLGSC